MDKITMFKSLRLSSLIPISLAISLWLGALLTIAHIGPARIQIILQDTGYWAPMLYLLFKVATYVVAPLNGTPLKVISGIMFGFWWAILLNVLAELIGSCVNYAIGRWAREGILGRKLEGTERKLAFSTLGSQMRWFELAFVRVFLSGIFDVLSYGAGILKIEFRMFAWVSFVFAVPPTAFVVGAGPVLLSGSIFGSVAYGLVAVCGVLIFFRSKWRRHEVAEN